MPTSFKTAGASLGWALAWALWCVSLTACPTAIVYLARRYEIPPDAANFGKELPWPAHAVDCLLCCHLFVTAAAAVAVYWMTRDWGVRSLAWLVELVALVIVAWLALAAGFATSGRYL